MPNLAIAIACFLLFFFALLYLYTPLKVRKTNPSPFSNFTLLPSLDDPPVYPEGRDFIHRTSQALIDHGFTLLAYLRNDHSRANFQNYSIVAILADDQHARLAQVCFIFTCNQTAETPILRTSTGIILETSYADGFILQSATLPEHNIFVSRPNTWGVSFHGYIKDAAPLLQIHEVLEQHRGHGTLRPTTASTDAKAHMERTNDEVMALQVQHGYYTRDETARLYRKTIYGAYRITWKLLPPLKQWTTFKARREARQWLAKAPSPAAPG